MPNISDLLLDDPALAPHPSLQQSSAAHMRVLGCSGSIARGCRTTAFLLDEDILIDAGTGVAELGLSELVAIDDIFLTHSHLDHVLSVPLLADSVMRRRAGRPPVQVHALPETLDILRRHVFNDLVWPDFTRIPSSQQPVLCLQPLQLGQVLRIGTQQRCIEVLPARHTVPAVGYAVQGAAGPAAAWWVYTGDTGPNPALWAALAGRTIGHLVIELAFPEADRQVAVDSQHHCPSSLAAELAPLPPGIQVLLTHIKPGELDTVLRDIAGRLPGLSLSALEAGQQIHIG